MDSVACDGRDGRCDLAGCISRSAAPAPGLLDLSAEQRALGRVGHRRQSLGADDAASLSRRHERARRVSSGNGLNVMSRLRARLHRSLTFWRRS